MTITPERLKKLAEHMGYRAKILDGEVKLKATYSYVREYNPLQNSDQCLELMEKVILRHAYHIRGGLNDGEVHIRDKDYNLIAKGSSIKEAVTLAAIKYVEEL